MHYEPFELKVFENIECEWPLFLLLLLLGALIEGDKLKAQEYRAKLDKLVLKSEETGLETVPELYYVPADKVWMGPCTVTNFPPQPSPWKGGSRWTCGFKFLPPSLSLNHLQIEDSSLGREMAF